MIDAPELFILRHGQTEWNAQHRMQGWLNSPLTEQGKSEATRQFEILRAVNLEGFSAISSPSGRAFQTAAIALGPLVDTIHTDPRLREIDVGEWSGARRDDLPQFDGPDGYLRQYEAAPGGEGLAGVAARIADFLSNLEGPAILVTHGITSRVMREMIVGEAALQGPGPNAGQGVVYHLKNGVQSLLR